MKKRDIVLILFNVISTALILFIYSENYSELIFNAFLFIGIMVFSSTVAGYISLEINKKLRTASKEELKAEDSVLLRGIGLLQSTAFIYINLIPNEDSIAFLILKLTIPIFTAIFFITRGYGAIRESSSQVLFDYCFVLVFDF